MKKILLLLFLLLWFEKNAFQQTSSFAKDSLDYYDMSLDQLLSTKAHGVPSELEKFINSLILASSKKPLSARESPGIVSLLTDEEIKNSGARDLIDVLRLVPGMDFGVDVEGVVGIGTRGLWAHEGKILLLLDGQEMNELLYATNPFGGRFAVDQIKKIEVIRGPGSSIYGGSAEYGVINIITKSASDIEGISLTGTYGRMRNTLGRESLNILAGRAKKNTRLSLGAFVGKASRSDQKYYDFYGNKYTLSADSSALNSAHLNMGVSFKELSLRWVIDLYHTTSRDAYTKAEKMYFPLNFDSHCVEIKYAAIFGKKKNFTITPKLNFKNQIPWQTAYQTDTITTVYDKMANRLCGAINLSYNLTRKINFTVGSEMYRDNAIDRAGINTSFNGQKKVAYTNWACYFQGLIKTHFVNFILGGRVDTHSEIGSAFVPRIGITKRFNKLNFKILYSNSFRAPSIENINLSNSIKPEFTRVIELEAGYQLTRTSLLTANIFDITTQNPIVYFYDNVLQEERYMNSGGSGSKGIEIEYRMRDRWGYFITNYSFYSVNGKEKIDSYKIAGNNVMLLAFPANKANVSACIKLGKLASLSPTLSYLGERYGYTHIDNTKNTVAEKFKPTLLANLFLTINEFGVKGLSMGMGCYDIFNSKYKFIQPYNGGHAPLPGPSREFILKITYEIKATTKK